MSPQTKDKVINFTLGLAALAATAYAFLASIYGGKEGSHQQIWIATGVASSALAVYVGNSEKIRLSAYREKMKSLAAEAEKNYENLIANLAPSVSQAAAIADTALPPTERAIRRGRLDQSIVVGVSEISEGARGVFYLWDSSTEIFSLVSQWPTAAVGEIKNGSPARHAHGALKRVARQGSVLMRHNTASPFHSTTPSTADDSVVTVQVIANDKVIGILAMDAKMNSFPSSQGFSNRDVRELLLYANMLASGIGA
ncbi:GAF domain-containing protein [Streptomyces avermitilis]|uniref:GAF domain-containing protein n=1 Tax=Streptomyces avermitilis TaxID=33903 RepID=UPI0034017E9D